MSEFKVGDIVLCTSSHISYDLYRGEKYKVTEVYDDIIKVMLIENQTLRNPKNVFFSKRRFELVTPLETQKKGQYLVFPGSPESRKSFSSIDEAIKFAKENYPNENFYVEKIVATAETETKIIQHIKILED